MGRKIKSEVYNHKNDFHRFNYKGDVLGKDLKLGCGTRGFLGTQF